MNATLFAASLIRIDFEYFTSNKSVVFFGKRFKKQAFLSNQKVVYHEAESDHYIYNTRDKWVVRHEFVLVINCIVYKQNSITNFYIFSLIIWMVRLEEHFNIHQWLWRTKIARKHYVPILPNVRSPGVSTTTKKIFQ